MHFVPIVKSWKAMPVVFEREFHAMNIELTKLCGIYEENKPVMHSSHYNEKKDR